MDIIDFLMKTLIEGVMWIFKILIKLAMAVIVGLCSLIGKLFNRN